MNLQWLNVQKHQTEEKIFKFLAKRDGMNLENPSVRKKLEEFLDVLLMMEKDEEEWDEEMKEEMKSNRDALADPKDAELNILLGDLHRINESITDLQEQVGAS